MCYEDRQLWKTQMWAFFYYKLRKYSLFHHFPISGVAYLKHFMYT